MKNLEICSEANDSRNGAHRVPNFPKNSRQKWQLTRKWCGFSVFLYTVVWLRIFSLHSRGFSVEFAAGGAQTDGAGPCTPRMAALNDLQEGRVYHLRVHGHFQCCPAS